MSAYRKLVFENDVLCVRLVSDEKKKFREKNKSSNHVSIVGASYKAENISNQHHTSLQYIFTKKIMCNINTK